MGSVTAADGQPWPPACDYRSRHLLGVPLGKTVDSFSLGHIPMRTAALSVRRRGGGQPAPVRLKARSIPARIRTCQSGADLWSCVCAVDINLLVCLHLLTRQDRPNRTC